LCIKNLAIKDEFSPFASRQQLLRQYCLDASGIAQEVVNLNEKNNHHA
jgi:deoxyxylulose-5-phosphate synthase